MPQETKAAPVVHMRLTGLFFKNSVTLNGEHDSVQIGSKVTAIIPGFIDHEGVPQRVGPQQRSQGFIIQQERLDKLGAGKHIAQAFVPWENVRTVAYGL